MRAHHSSRVLNDALAQASTRARQRLDAKRERILYWLRVSPEASNAEVSRLVGVEPRRVRQVRAEAGK